jgi:hypothetical protein
MLSATFRKAINWLGILALAHIAAMIFFNFFLSGSVAEISVNDPLRANLTFFAFNFVFDIIFAFIYFKIKTSYVEYQKSFRELLRSDDYSFSKYFKEYILKEQKIMTVVFLLFQIPFVMFFAIWGMSLLYPILLEQIYVMDAGSYLLTHSALAGWLINTFIFTLVFLFVRLLFFAKMKKDLKY